MFKGLFSLLPYSLYRLGGAVLPHVPPGLGYRLAEIGGALLYILAPAVRHRVYANVSHVLGDKANHHTVRHMVRQALGNLLKNYCSC